MTPLPSELLFASFLAYCPRGNGDLVLSSQRVMRQVKGNIVPRTPTGPEGPESTAVRVARRLQEIRPERVMEFFHREAALVPVPRSTPQKKGALWPAMEIAVALHASGLGARVLPSLRRIRPVTKAATAVAKQRPKAREHQASLEVVRPLELPGRIVLIDAIVTRGAQLLGAAWTVWATRPDADVRAFAAVRTVSKPEDLARIADKPGPLGATERERARMHAYYTDRILARCPALADVARIATAAHERCDGSGYHRGQAGRDLGRAARLLAAADAFSAMQEPRAHRPEMSAAAAKEALAADARAGRLCREAVDALVGTPRPARERVAPGLTDRETEVLILVARGKSNREIGVLLDISPRTVQHHVAHVYDKLGLYSRAGAALFAVEKGLL